VLDLKAIFNLDECTPVRRSRSAEAPAPVIPVKDVDALTPDLPRSRDAMGLPDDRPAVLRAICPYSRHRRFWLSIHGVTVCGLCHPPAHGGLVSRWDEV
jgi:hypothetical protein